MARFGMTMLMKRSILLALIALGNIPLSVGAVSYSTIQTQEERIAKGIKVKGEAVCLFESGTKDVKKEFKINDILVVFREGPGSEIREVGKIKIISYTGDDYHMRAIVLEGEVGSGDIAKKGEAASLIISADPCK